MSLQRHPQGVNSQYLKLMPHRAVTLDYKCTSEVGCALSLSTCLSCSIMSGQEEKSREKNSNKHTHTYMHTNTYVHACTNLHTYSSPLDHCKISSLGQEAWAGSLCVSLCVHRIFEMDVRLKFKFDVWPWLTLIWEKSENISNHIIYSVTHTYHMLVHKPSRYLFACALNIHQKKHVCVITHAYNKFSYNKNCFGVIRWYL